MTTPKAGLRTMPTGALKNEQIFNEGVVLLEQLAYRGVISRAVTDPSGISPSPSNGDAWLVPEGSPNALGDWSGQGGNLAVYYNGWRFVPPGEGLTIWIADEAQSVQYRSGAWVDVDEFPPTLLDDLDDVDLSGSPSPQDGDALVYDAALGKWVHGAGAASLRGTRLTRTTSQAISSATFTTILWDAETYDDDGLYDVGAANGQVVIGTSGRYDLCFQWETDPETGTWHVYITRNGTDNTARIAYETRSASGAIGAGALMALGVELTAGDVIRAVMWVSTATNLSATVSSLTVRKLG